jgi:curved DNA-binding protein CbpA
VVNPSNRTLYQVLGVGPRATQEELRQAYVALARILHPDRYVEGSIAERALANRRMREVNGAWDVLGRPGTRADYDTGLREADRVSAPAGAPPRPESTRKPVEDVEDDDPELPAHQVFLLRRGPVLVAVAIAVALFIGTAYASTKPAPTGPTPTTVCDPALRGGCDTQVGS